MDKASTLSKKCSRLPEKWIARNADGGVPICCSVFQSVSLSLSAFAGGGRRFVTATLTLFFPKLHLLEQRFSLSLREELGAMAESDGGAAVVDAPQAGGDTTADVDALMDLFGDGDAEEVAAAGGEVGEAASEKDEGDHARDEKSRRRSKADKRARAVGGGGSRKKKGNRKVKHSSFVDLAAESGDDSDETQDEEERDDASVHTVDDVVDTSYIDKHKQQRHLLFADEDNLSEEEIAKRLKEKYKVTEQARRAAAAEHRPATMLRAPSGIVQGGIAGSALYNPASDAKIFAVKVRPGQAKLLVARIVNKCDAYLRGHNSSHQRQDLGIIGAFCFDHIKEWIYCESHRQRFVEQAVNGLEGVFRYKVHVVDYKEVLAMLAFKHKKKLEVGTFVRVRSGIYRGDLAQVVGIVEEGLRVQLKLVPREDFIGREFAKKRYRKGEQVPPQRFFVKELAKSCFARDDGSVRWGDLIFDAAGYLLRTVLVKHVVAGGGPAAAGSTAIMRPPTVEELAFFHRGDSGQIGQAFDATVGAGDVNNIPSLGGGGTIAANGFGATVGATSDAQVAIDDCVRVVSGPLAGFTGTIAQMYRARGDPRLILTLVPKAASARGGAVAGPTHVQVPATDVVPHFAVGSHVQVLAGPDTGESGTVLGHRGGHIVMLGDRDMRELLVKPDECRACRVIAKGQLQGAGGTRLFDLVSDSTDGAVGCVVEISREHAVLVTLDGTAIRSALRSLKPCLLPPKAIASDRFGNSIHRGDAVTLRANLATDIATTAPAGRTLGKVLHVFNGRVFVQAPVHPGMVAAKLVEVHKAMDVAVAGGRCRTATTAQRPAARPMVEKPLHAIPGERRTKNQVPISNDDVASLSASVATAQHAFVMDQTMEGDYVEQNN